MSVGEYLKFGELMSVMPEDYMVSVMCDGKEYKHCVAWVLKQEDYFYKLYDGSVLSFYTDVYNEVCTIEVDLKSDAKVKACLNEKLNLGFRRPIL